MGPAGHIHPVIRNTLPWLGGGCTTPRTSITLPCACQEYPPCNFCPIDKRHALSFPNHTKTPSRGQRSRVQGLPPANGRDGTVGKRQRLVTQDWAQKLEQSTWEQSWHPDPSSPGSQRGQGREAKATYLSGPCGSPALLTPGEALCPSPPDMTWSLRANSATPLPWVQGQTFTSWASVCSSVK